MSELVPINSKHPQPHLIDKVLKLIRQGGVIAYPTDSGYALGCHIGDKNALDRIRRIRKLDEHHHFTLMCRDLSELATYAQVNNRVFRLLKTYTPGSYTFILPATRDVPRRLQHIKRKTIGLRIPAHPVALALLDALEEPLMSTTLLIPETDLAMLEPQAINELLGGQIDLIIDSGFCGLEPTSIIDLVEPEPKIIRKGKGDVTPFILKD